MNINIGISATQRKEIAQRLSQALADIYTRYPKTHNFRWNVTGPMFQTLQLMFETHYTELAVAVDDIAERIRSLGEPAPGTYKAFNKLSSIEEDTGIPPAQDMIRALFKAHECTARTSREVFSVAERANGQPTCDLLTQRINIHEKTAWMLRRLLA